MSCSHTTRCELFAQFALNPALKVWQTHYCEGKFQTCARYQSSLSGGAVPLNLLPNGARIEAPRSSAVYGAVALFNAILKGRISMVESLIQHGVDVNTPNANGTTAIMLAVSKGNLNIIRLLLDHGANPMIANSAGDSTLEVALRLNNPEVIAMLKQAKPRRSRTDSHGLRSFWSRWFVQKSA